MPTAETHGHPDIFLITDFVSPTSPQAYSEYACGYMDREEAICKRIDRQYAGYVDEYMDNPHKHKDAGEIRQSGLFNASVDAFSEEQKQLVKKVFDRAQKNGSPLWRPILSFKNSFLADHGIYDPKTGQVDDARLRDLTRRTVAVLLKDEGMQNSAVWAAGIHYNTGNIHIHVAVVEPNPTRQKIRYHGQLQYRARLAMSTIHHMKSQMAHCIVDHAQEMKKLQILSRERIIGDRPKDLFRTDRALYMQYLRIYLTLPQDKRLWKYNMHAIKDQRPMIDELSRMYIARYHPQEFQAFVKELDKREAVYRALYGKDAPGYKENKIRDLYTRLGNSILSEMRAYRPHPQGRKAATGNPMRQRFQRGVIRGRAMQEAMASLKRAMNQDHAHWKAQRAYDALEDALLHGGHGGDSPMLG